MLACMHGQMDGCIYCHPHFQELAYHEVLQEETYLD